MLACDDSASMAWVRLSVRGMPSREIAVTFRAASCCASDVLMSGASMPNTVWPARSLVSCFSLGRVTVRMMSAVAYRSSVLEMDAPASL